MLNYSVAESSDNPWANAAALRQPIQRRFRLSGPRSSPRQWHEEEDDDEEDVDPDSCSHQTYLFTLEAWHTLDGMLGAFLVIYGMISASKYPDAKEAYALILVLGSLLLVRSVLGNLAFCTSWFCQGCGLWMSAASSPPLAFTYLFLLGINLLYPHAIRKYLSEYPIFSPSAQAWEEEHQRLLDFLLLGLFVLECVRWQLILEMGRRLEKIEDAELSRPLHSSDDEKPWWWQVKETHSTYTDDLLSASLLPVAENGRRQSSTWSSWWPFQLGFSTDARDDASVDFASVQEEWATRSLEDPYWWTREKEETTSRTGDISWPDALPSSP